MNSNVRVRFYCDKKNGSIKFPNAVFEGRLLGAVSLEERDLIICNEEVSKKVATKGSTSINDTVRALEKLLEKEERENKKPNYEKGFGSVVFTVTATRKNKDDIPLETKTKQICLTSPINLLSETSDKQITMKCEDKSYITVENI